nr:hypothetical protein [Tanacetum cinerariifolium]
MTSFGYRLNPRYAIKECSSCGTLYTRDCSCSKGNVEEKILVPKPPKNYARCARCEHPVDGPYCQGCTFLRKKLEEDLVTHFQGFQNTSESSDDSTNAVNIPLEPFVVKQDHGSFVDKIICGLNKAPDSPHLHTFSPNQFHCFHYKTILESYGDTTILKRRREDDDDQEGPSAGSDRGSKRRREGGKHESASTPSEPATRRASRSTTGTQSRQMSASESAFAEEPVKPPTPDRDWNKTLPAIQGSAQTWISDLAKQADSRSSFNELLDTPIDFSNFIMNRLCVDTLTPELLAGPTFELMRGSCTSMTELEYHLEEVYKAITDQLDWVNPEGQQYPHNLLQPLLLIPDNRGRRTKAADYGHIKLIEDLVPRTMWIQEPLNYDKHALWGVSHWGRKRQQFYGFAVNRESALDVYSKRRIIAVTDLKIVEWHNYKHLDWISVRRDDDKIYKFIEGNFKRLRLQDIKDMLLLLVQGKLSNLTVEERFAFNVSLRMFTRSIVIQRCVGRSSTGSRKLPENAQPNQARHYLPQAIWRKGEKDRAAAMIQSIDKMLKTRRIMRSLERFVGGRLYEGDFRMLQRTI